MYYVAHEEGPGSLQKHLSDNAESVESVVGEAGDDGGDGGEGEAGQYEGVEEKEPEALDKDTGRAEGVETGGSKGRGGGGIGCWFIRDDDGQCQNLASELPYSSLLPLLFVAFSLSVSLCLSLSLSVSLSVSLYGLSLWSLVSPDLSLGPAEHWFNVSPCGVEQIPEEEGGRKKYKKRNKEREGKERRNSKKETLILL